MEKNCSTRPPYERKIKKNCFTRLPYEGKIKNCFTRHLREQKRRRIALPGLLETRKEEKLLYLASYRLQKKKNYFTRIPRDWSPKGVPFRRPQGVPFGKPKGVPFWEEGKRKIIVLPGLLMKGEWGKNAVPSLLETLKEEEEVLYFAS